MTETVTTGVGAEPTLTESLVAFADRVAREGVPAHIEAIIVRHVLDTAGLCLAAHGLDTSTAVIEHVLAQGGVARARILGRREAVPPALAALAGGVLAHSLDFDDTHLPSVLHPSASVVPAAVATAEAARATGEQLVRAVAVGIEATVRIGMAGYDPSLGNSVYFEHGQHATSICGALGSALAVGMLTGLTGTQLRDALGIAASMASGIIEANRTSGTVKRIHCGWAAHSGVVAADLARLGITGPPTALEGRFGFFEAFLHGRAFPAEVSEGLGSRWEVERLFIKPYPANHFTHAVVDAARTLRERGLRADDLASVRVGVPTAVVRTIGDPIELKRRPRSGYHAQFSGPYAVAVGLLGGGGLGVSAADYTDELAASAQRQRIMDLVDIVPDGRCDEIFPHEFPAVLVARTHGGDEHVVEVLTTRGGPRRPLTDDELGLKFRTNARTRLAPDRIDRARAILLGLPGVDDVTHVVDALTPDADPAPKE